MQILNVCAAEASLTVSIHDKAKEMSSFLF